MSVVAFERRHGQPASGANAELNTIVAALHAAIAPASGREWETGTTENGDAQFYLLGPLPDQACELCVSRIGGRYILEDGAGRLLFEHRKSRYCRAACKGRSPIHAVVACRTRRCCCGVRFGTIIHEKVEPMLTESEELLVQLAPQLAAFA